MKALILSMIVSFATTYIITPYLIRFLRAVGVVGTDLHKIGKPRLPSSGGICVAAGIIAGLLSYVGISTFIWETEAFTIPLLGVISSILLVTFVGLIDDLNVKAKKVGDVRVGLPQWIKPLLTLPAAVPLMVLNAGVTTMTVPLLGTVNFGILYPLFIVPLGVVGASNMVNMLGGFNGAEAGMGIVYLLGLGIFALITGSSSSVIFLIAAGALIAFMKFNWFPAKILPGDSLTYLLGAVVAVGVIVGNMEKIGVFMMIPFFIEFMLKLRSRFKAKSTGLIQKDGTIKSIYGGKIYSLTHVIMRFGRLKEKQIAGALILMEIIFVIFAIAASLYH
jgi:UDP-N-acetylglucosamine--dolichyl-phosphate N-acetylglucosaminephosphotransferase